MPHRRSRRSRRLRQVRWLILRDVWENRFYDRLRRELIYLGDSPIAPFIRGEVLQGISYINPVYARLLNIPPSGMGVNP